MRYHFAGSLTARDAKRHIPYMFLVPEGSGRLEISFEFAPDRAHGITNLLTLTLLDPNGFRGAGHRDGAAHRVRLSAAEASPGYLPGPLPAGEWTVEIDTHMVMPGEPVRYRLDVASTAGAAAPSTNLPGRSGQARAVLPGRGAGWYRGDLHSHTHHSDAGQQTVAGLVAAARGAGLDFVFLTDHNTTAGLAEMDALTSEDLLTAGGIELTTFWGHALCLGTRQWVDWRVRPGTGEMARIAAATDGRDGMFVIAHPQSVGDPGCTGCNWRYGEMMPGNARSVEVWNGPWAGDSGNEQALALWYDWLNQGLRLAATAGTDAHCCQDYAAGPGFNVVYAGTLSEAALLTAVRAGHLVLSAGPSVTFEAQDVNGGRSLPGDTVSGPATFRFTWAGCPAGARVRLMANGRLLEEWPAGGEGSYERTMAPDQADWVVVEIRDREGAMLALTNPIYLQPARDSAWASDPQGDGNK